MDFEEIYRRYFGDVYRYLLRLSGSETVAEDVTSETFLRAMQALPRFRGDCQFSTWLYRLAANAATDTARRQKRHADTQDIDDTALPDGEDTPHQAAEKREAVANVRRALAKLKPEYRTVLLLRFMEDLSYEEIGHALGLPPGTVKSRINRGKAQLKEILLRQGNLFGLESVILAGKEDRP